VKKQNKKTKLWCCCQTETQSDWIGTSS